MQLNEKSKRILDVIVHEQQITIEHLTLMLPYSRRTVEYELERIQEWLVAHELPKLKIEGVNVSLAVTKELFDRVEQAELVWSEEERELLIVLYALTHDEFLSALHFQHLLDVSKYTVQESLNAVKKRSARFGLDFAYTRKSGYHFNGHFQTMTLYLYRTIEQLMDKSTKYQLLDLCLDDWGREVGAIITQIEQYEAHNQFQFVESHREKIAYFLLIGKRLLPDAFVQDEDIAFADNVEQSVRDHFHDVPHLWATLTMLIQSGPKVSEEMEEDIQQNLSETMLEVIDRFEALSCTHVVEREALCAKLVLHAKATLQRVYTEIMPPEELKRYVQKEHSVLNVLVDRSLDSIRQKLDTELPETEVMYFTLHFAAHLHQQGQNLDEKMKAIVVCPSGISVSHMLDHILKNQFPEFVFLPPISQRDVKQFAPLVDLIFTTVPLPLTVQEQTHVTLVPTLPTRLEQMALKRQINQRFFAKNDLSSIQLEDVLEVIKNNATIHNEKELRRGLSNLFQKRSQLDEWKGAQPVLNQLVTKDEIRLMDQITDWKESVRVAAKPLIENKAVDDRYVETMIQNVEEHGPYIVLMPDVAIPHARPEDGVNQLGMSILKLDEPTFFPGEKPVRIFFVLAAIDQTTHLKALAQLTELLGNEADLTTVLNAKSSDEILDVINRYSEEE